MKKILETHFKNQLGKLKPKFPHKFPYRLNSWTHTKKYRTRIITGLNKTSENQTLIHTQGGKNRQKLEEM